MKVLRAACPSCRPQYLSIVSQNKYPAYLVKQVQYVYIIGLLSYVVSQYAVQAGLQIYGIIHSLKPYPFLQDMDKYS